MGNISEFNSKLAEWLETQQEFFKDHNVQEYLFDISESIKKNSGMMPEEQELICKIATSMMKLSFVINNNPEHTDKLISYLG